MSETGSGSRSPSSKKEVSFSRAVFGRMLALALLTFAALYGLWLVAQSQAPYPYPFEPAPSLATVEGWRWPIEEKAFLRNAEVPNAALQSVVFAADGQRGWAVGFGGTIVATADAGATWKPQASATTNWLYGVTFSADGQRGWAVGWGGTFWGEGGTIVAEHDHRS